MKSYAHSITSRKNIPLSLAKKFQYKYANQILNSNPMVHNEINTNEIHITSSNYNELILRVLNLTSDEFICYSKIEFKGTTYKIGYFLTRFIEEVCLYEILEIILVKANFKVQFVVQQIEVDFFNSHLKAYQVNRSKSIILKTILSPDSCNGPPVNINESFSGNLLLRVKEYYSD